MASTFGRRYAGAGDATVQDPPIVRPTDSHGWDRVGTGTMAPAQAGPAEIVFAPLLAQIYGYLATGTSVHLVGPPGSGRSEVIDLLQDGMTERGLTPVRVDGNVSWRDEPFATLLAAGLGAEEPRRGIPEMAAAVRRMLSTTATVLLCDDADELDSYSAGALLQAHRQRRYVAVTTSRPQHPVKRGSLVSTLSPAVEIRVDALAVEHLHKLAASILGGPLEASALSRVLTKSGGLYGLARAILEVGQHTGTLVPTAAGVWTAPGPLWSSRLVSALAPYVEVANESLWDPATVLATTGPLPVDHATALLGEEQLRSMLALDLARGGEDAGGHVVGIYPPLLGEYLVREGSVIGRAAGSAYLRERAAAPLPAASLPSPVSSSPIFSAASGLLEPWHALAIDRSLHTVYTQRVQQRLRDAVRSRYEAWSTDRIPEQALPLVVALRATDAPPKQIREVLSRTEIVPDSPALATLAIWHAMWVASQTGDVDAAAATLWGYESAVPAFRTLLCAGEAHLRFLHDRVPADLDACADPPRQEAGAPYEAAAAAGQELLQGVRIEAALARGQTDTVQALLDDYDPASSVYRAHKTICADLSLILSADMEAGIEHAQHHLAHAWAQMRPGLIQAYGYVALLGLTLAGRLAEAGDLLARLISVTSVTSFREMFHTGILSIGAEISAWQGRGPYARALAAQAQAACPGAGGSGPYPAMVPIAACAAASRPSVGATSSDWTADQLWQAAGARLSAGYVLSGIFLAAEAVEYSLDRSKAGLIEEALADAQSPLVLAVGGYVLAACNRDPEAVKSSIEELRRAGGRLHAIKAAVTLTLLLRDHGRYVEAVECAEAAWDEANSAGTDGSGLFIRLAQDVGLSAREIEILSWLDDPASVPEIAAILGVSARTIETHLHNVATKLGVSGRNRLVRAANTWLHTPVA